MDHLEQTIRELVAEALKKEQNKPDIPTFSGKKGVFTDIEEAINAAQKAYETYVELPLNIRKKIIANIRKVCHQNNEIMSKMAHEETGYGRYEDKLAKNVLGIDKTPGVEDLEPEAFSDENGLTIVERAPYGVIGAITPSTNSTISIISNAIGMISAGNTVVFNPHPAAKNVSVYIIDFLNKAIMEMGGPENVVVCMEKPTIASAKILMAHPKIALMVVTGGPAVVDTAMSHKKKVIAAGPGNPPVIVDETANIQKAGKAIVDGASFDNNVICICEKETIVVEAVADELKAEMVKNGAYELNEQEIKKVTELVIADPGRKGHEGAPNKKYVGKNASCIAKDIGLDIPESTRLLLCEVDENHPLMWTEQLMPVMPITRVKDVDKAIDLALEVEHGFHHTAIMHSLNLDKLSKMAKLSNCSIFIKNGPSYAGLGFGGAGFASFTIASPTGEGVTKTKTFTRERRCTLVDHFRII